MFKLSWKLGLTYLILIIATLLIISALILSYFYQSYLGAQKSMGYTYANIISSKAASALWRKDYAYLDYLTRDYAEQIGHRIVMVNPQGRVWADSAGALVDQKLRTTEIQVALRGKNEAMVHTSPAFGDVLQLAVPIKAKDRVMGAVFLAMDVNQIQTNMTVIRQQLEWYGIIAGLVIFVLSLLISSYLTRPIKLLENGVQRMGEGNYGLQVPVVTHDELGSLARSFNAMSSQLQREDEVRRRFVADAAHELRSPVASIRLMVENLLREAPPEAPSKVSLQGVDQELGRLTKLINDLLTLSSVDKAKTALRVEEVNVGELLNAVCQEIAPLAEDKQVDIHLVAEQVVYWPLDGTLIYRVVYNLLDNAVKYSAAGSNVRVSYQVNDSDLNISVADQGEGIKAEELPRLFERFYRADKARSRATGGTGLGLAIVQEIVSLHGGEVQVQSEAGRGSCFTVRLPN